MHFGIHARRAVNEIELKRTTFRVWQVRDLRSDAVEMAGWLCPIGLEKLAPARMENA
jgi:hypothetical protein